MINSYLRSGAIIIIIIIIIILDELKYMQEYEINKLFFSESGQFSYGRPCHILSFVNFRNLNSLAFTQQQGEVSFAFIQTATLSIITTLQGAEVRLI